MRDLKHLIAFENLLQETNNELVRQGKADGKRALGYTCYFMPEVLLDLPGCFAVRLRAPKCTSPDMATYYMSSRTCHYGRSLFERALEGGYNFLDADFGTETCTVTCRFQEHLGYMDVIQNPDFFVTFTDVPFKRNQNSIEHYEGQLQAHVLDPLHEKFGIDISDEALMKAIDLHNGIYGHLITDSPYFFIALVAMVLGSQLFLAGFLGDLISRQNPNRNDYQIEKEIRCGK